MKNVISFVIMLVLLTACGSARKLQQSKVETTIDSTAVVKEVGSKSETSIDTTRKESGKVTITEVEFFPPTPSTDEPPPDKGGVKNPTKQGAVKKIKQTVIEANIEQKGESKESSESKDTESVADVSRSESDTKKQQEPTPDPYRWRYFFYIALLFAALLLYLKRAPIVDWLKRILSGILKIL